MIGKKNRIFSANSIHKLLSDDAILNAHADILFPAAEDAKNHDARKLFVTRTKMTAEAFLKARVEIEHLFLLGLQSMEAIHTADDLGEQQKVYLNYVASTFVASLVDQQYLIRALWSDMKEGSTTDISLNKLQTRLASQLGSETLLAEKREIERKEFIGALKAVIKDLGIEGVILFKQLHNSWKSDDSSILVDYSRLVSADGGGEGNPPGSNTQADANSFNVGKDSRMYGIVIGPGYPEDLKAINTIKSINFNVSHLVTALSSGFEGGRLAEGLETLINRYVRAHADSPLKDDVALQERHILIDAMVQFAQKVLFVANHNGLLQKERNSSVNSGYSGGKAPSSGGMQGLDHYVMVLQAVGNSILIQADELTHRSSHERKMEKKLVAEKAALLKSLNPSPLTILSEIKAAIQNKNVKLDDLVTPLQQKLDTSLAELGVITKVREGLINGNLVAQLSTHQELKKSDLTAELFIKNYTNIVHLRVVQILSTNKNAKTGEVRALEAVESYMAKHHKKIKGLTGTKSGTDWHADVKALVLADEEARQRMVSQNKEGLDGLKNSQEAERKKIENSLAVVGEVQSAVLSEADKIGGPAVQDRVMVCVVKEIEKRLLKETESDKQKPYKEALGILADIHIPIPTVPDDFDGVTDAKGVLDSLITTLNYEYLQAVKMYGKDSETARRIAGTIKEAYANRTGLVFVRPSSAYLRSSYPATSLQSDPGLGWYNMLEQQFFRSLPGMSFFSQHDSKAQIRGEIDKQYWQTVNSVRVAGAGRTQYVLAKDDIGNWYVKSYSSDPQDIIKSAKNLALFSLGSAGNTELLSELTGGAGPEGSNTPADGTRSSMGKLLDKHTSHYFESITNSLEKALQVMNVNTLTNGIEKRWTEANDAVAADARKEALKVVDVSGMNAALELLESEKTKVLKAMKEKKPVNTEAANAIVAGMHELRRFDAAVDGALVDKVTVAADRSNLSKTSNRYINDQIAILLADRNKAVKTYDTAVRFISEVVDQPK